MEKRVQLPIITMLESDDGAAISERQLAELAETLRNLCGTANAISLRLLAEARVLESHLARQGGKAERG